MCASDDLQCGGGIQVASEMKRLAGFGSCAQEVTSFCDDGFLALRGVVSDRSWRLELQRPVVEGFVTPKQIDIQLVAIMQDLPLFRDFPLNHVCRAFLLNLDGATFNGWFAQFRRECKLMSLTSKAVDEENLLLAACTMGVDVGGRVDQVDAPHIVVGNLSD